MTHQVFARKYRPSNFKDLKGQDVMVQIISNAIKLSKLAHAYLFTGIRGTGKTTVARIIAKTVNCSNLSLNTEDLMPCSQCKSCIAMQEGSHLDIIEMDAASKTGVDDIRDLIESSRFQPMLGKYKVYIIDEVHMLSTSAFNALLKTLEEPQSHLLFIFATTEIRKIPQTVASRCQTFALNRLNINVLSTHLASICEQEQIKASQSALRFIAQFSEGSVRDALSLLETVSMYGGGEITEEIVSQVLGLPSVDQIYKLLDFILIGNPQKAISIAKDLYSNGTEPEIIIEELLKASNKISKHLAGCDETPSTSDHEQQLLKEITSKTDVGSITTIWKMLFNAIEELKYTGSSLDTLEILIIRICYLSAHPSIDSIIAGLAPAPLPLSRGREAAVARHCEDLRSKSVAIKSSSQTASQHGLLRACEASPRNDGSDRADSYGKFQDVTDLFYQHKELLLYHQLVEDVRLISYKPGVIEARLEPALPIDFPAQIISKLNKWTNMKWQFVVGDRATPASLSLQQQEREDITNNPLVKDVLGSFPGAQIKSIVKVS